MTSPRAEGCSTPERQRQRKRDRRSYNAPWLGRSVPLSPQNEAVAVTRPPPPGRSSARYWGESPFLQRYAKTASRKMIRSRIRNQWNSCSSGGMVKFLGSVDQTRCSVQDSSFDMQEGRPASHYHGSTVKWPVTWWATTRRVDWRIDWCCVFVAKCKTAANSSCDCNVTLVLVSPWGLYYCKEMNISSMNIAL